MDFLPAGWLVRVDDIHASMTMGQPFPGVWLPREMNIHAGVTIASGPLEAAYDASFTDYKLAETKTLIRIPKARPTRAHHPTTRNDGPSAGLRPRAASRRPKWSARSAYTATRTFATTRSSGSRASRVGQPPAADGLRDDRTAAEGQRAFSSPSRSASAIDRSTALTDVAIVLLVHERDGHTSETRGERPSVWRLEAARRAG